MSKLTSQTTVKINIPAVTAPAETASGEIVVKHERNGKGNGYGSSGRTLDAEAIMALIFPLISEAYSRGFTEGRQNGASQITDAVNGAARDAGLDLVIDSSIGY